MTKTNYSYENFDNHTARAFGKELNISTKTAINIANKIRGMDANKAVVYLEKVANLKLAVPFTRFTDGVGHRRGDMASGRFPIKAATAINGVLKSAIANATNLNMSEDLVIANIVANKAASRFHQGRQRRRAMKQTHIEIVLKEVEGKSKSANKKDSKVASKKAEPKPVAKEEKSKAPEKSTEKKEEKPADKTPAKKTVEKTDKPKANNDEQSADGVQK